MNFNKEFSPIFLLGMQRSGTSLVRAFLANHPQIAIPIKGETQFFAKWAKKIDTLETKEEIEKFHQQFMSESKVNQWGIDWKNFSPSLTGNEVKSKQYFTSLMNYYAQQKGIERWGEKSTSHINTIEEILKLYPKAQYLIIVRDPRDSFCSVRSWKKGKKLSPKAYGEEWAATYSRAVGLLLRAGASWKIVRHESVVEETRRVIEEIFTWLGEPFDETFLQLRDLNWEQNSSFGEQNWTNPNHQQYTKELKIDPSTVGRWKELLTSKEIRELEKSAYNSLMTFGYEVTNTESFLYPSKWKKIIYKLKTKLIKSQ